MKKYIIALSLLLGVTASASDENATKVFSNFSNNFQVGSIAYKVVPEGYVTKPDPSCQNTWPEGPVCGDIQVPYGKKEIVEVSVGYYNTSGPHNNDDRVETAEYQLGLHLFTSSELDAIKKAKGFKAVKLAREMYSLEMKSVKLPVTEPVYGNCDSEMNCQVVGEETVLRTFTQVTLVRK